MSTLAEIQHETASRSTATESAGRGLFKNLLARLSSLAGLIGELTGPHEPRRERPGLEDELQRLSRERSLARSETRLLNAILRHDAVDSSGEALLRCLVPQTSSAFAALFDVSQPATQLVASRGLSESSQQSLVLPTGWLEQLQEEPWIVAGVQHGGSPTLESAEWLSNISPSDRRKTREVWLIGFRDGSRLAAVLLTSRLWPAAASPDEQLALLSRVGRTFARHLLKDREFQRHTAELQTFREMLELRSITDRASDRPLETLGRYVERVRSGSHMDRAAVFLVSRRSNDTPAPVVVSGHHDDPHREAAAQCDEAKLAWEAMTRQQARHFDAMALRSLGVSTPIGSAFVWPLRHSDRMLGALVLTRASQCGIDLRQRQLVEWSAGHLAETLHRVFSEASIRRQARQDGLTDLTNRRTFETLLAGEVDRVRLGVSSECSLLLADLDRFKSINDTHGHPAGDEVLRVVSRRLQQQVARLRVGERSVVARYGGEELAVLLPGVGLAGALRVAEEIRSAVEAEPISFAGKLLRATISLGAASCPNEGMTPGAVVSAADQALYQAKKTGRNRVCSSFDN